MTVSNNKGYPLIKNLEELKEAAHAFANEFMETGPFSEFIAGCGYINKIGFAWFQSDRAKTQEQFEEEFKASGEDPYEGCITLHLLKPLPEDMKLPDTYMGFKVFVEVTGEAMFI